MHSPVFEVYLIFSHTCTLVRPFGEREPGSALRIALARVGQAGPRATIPGHLQTGSWYSGWMVSQLTWCTPRPIILEHRHNSTAGPNSFDSSFRWLLGIKAQASSTILDTALLPKLLTQTRVRCSSCCRVRRKPQSDAFQPGSYRFCKQLARR